LLAGLSPQLAAIAAAVVSQHLLDDQAAGSEPGLSPLEEPDRGLAGLIGVDLGIGQPGVVINGGVDEPVALPRVVMTAELAT
jgi:hypothetical protein